LQGDSAAGSHINPYIVRITNDLYQPAQLTETAITSRMMQRTVGAAEAAAAKAAASAVAAAAGGLSAKAGISNKASTHSMTGLVGLHQVCICTEFCVCCNQSIIRSINQFICSKCKM